MKNTYSIAERNRIVEAHFWCIDAVLDCNARFLRANRIEREDAYQHLAEQLICLAAALDADARGLSHQILEHLSEALYGCGSAFHLFGITEAPGNLERGSMVSFEAMREKLLRREWAVVA